MRFPEFNGEWKESTIGKEFELYSGNTPSRLDKENFVGDVNWITSGELKDHYIGDTKEKISESSAKENNLRLMPEGTFVIAIYGLEAEGVRSTGSIITKQSTISQACMAFTPKGDISNEFLYSWYKKHGNVIGIKYAQGTKQQNLSYDIIEKFKIRYPSLKEQDKLNSFISLLDTHISTQSRIIEDLRSLKKYIHNRVFSKGNTLFGERNSIRLSDIATKITRKNKGNTINNVLSNSAAMGIVPQVEVFDKEIANEDNTANYYVIGNGDFVYNPRKSAQAPFGPINMYKGQAEGIISPLYLCFQVTNINKNYLLHYFMSNVWYSYIYSNGDTGVRHDRVSIKDEIFLDMLLYIHTVDKQQEIANMMEQVNAKIALEELYLTKLQKQKDYLLAAMFV